MNYALNLAPDGRVLSVTFEKYAAPGMPIVSSLPDGDPSDYLYKNGAFVYMPLPAPDPEPEEASWQDRIEAQVLYTAIMTDTLVEE